MTGTRPFWLLSVFAFAVLGAASVWMGGLNQDEGWYLYAAQMVAEGHLPYRDFFFTQGPIMPFVYSAFAWVLRGWGLLGARVLTLAVGAAGLLFAVALARRLVHGNERKNLAGLTVFLLLGGNLYHLYYLTIPKTYALASLFVAVGFYLLAVAFGDKRGDDAPARPSWSRAGVAALAGLSLAFAAGTRISLGAILPVVGLWLLCARDWRRLGWFCVGGFAGLALVYGPFLLNPAARDGLLAAQRYHAARGGFDLVWTVGSFSRLVRWYLPVFVLLGLVGYEVLGANKDRVSTAPSTQHPAPSTLLLLAFLAVFAVQMLAPFPYEDYQVPVMGLLAVYAAVAFGALDFDAGRPWLKPLLVLGMTWACSFGSPLLEKWSTNGQDRFWSLKKPKTELAQLREVAREINALDPGGKDILTQDLYLAIETGRKVPRGLEMGPFAMLSDAEWRTLLRTAPCGVAALSGYSFAVNPPKCDERPVSDQMEYWSILKRSYELVSREEHFGQNQTTLLVLKRKVR